ncbi:MAG: hypothetical protein IJJ13_01590 [Lachnospiraceae bacterium]|nr:hypothetical protein [Lachnospiraceae bacterium]
MGKHDLDGQLNLFGNDPYQPKKAKASEEQVELSTEAEEFLSVGRKKKKAPEEPHPVEEVPPEKAAVEKTVKEVKTKPASEKKAGKDSLSIVMQQSFADGSGRTATVAYVDYNCVYTEDEKGAATLTHYPDAKTAVDRYLETVTRFSKTDGMKKSKEHPALRNIQCKEAE